MQLFYLMVRKTCTKKMAKKKGIEEILILLWWLPIFFSAGEGTCFLSPGNVHPSPRAHVWSPHLVHIPYSLAQGCHCPWGRVGLGWRSNTKIHKSMISRSRFWSQPKCDAAVLQDARKSRHALASGWVCSTKIIKKPWISYKVSLFFPPTPWISPPVGSHANHPSNKQTRSLRKVVFFVYLFYVYHMSLPCSPSL